MSSASTDSELAARFDVLRREAEAMSGMSPAQRDRMLQIQLAALRGPQRNFRLLCEMTDALAPIRRRRLGVEGVDEMADPRTLSLIARLSRELDEEGIVNALTGSVAAGLHGEPITSMDVDVVVTMTPAKAVSIARRWKQDLGADEYSLRLAAEHHHLTTLLHPPTGLKVDISVLPDEPYYHEVLRRRVRFTPEDNPEPFWIATPEDVVLMKLLWRKDSGSEKQWSNALGIVQVQGKGLDRAYMRDWAERLGLEADLEQLMQEAQI